MADGDVCARAKPGLRAAESVRFFAGDEEAVAFLDSAIAQWIAACAPQVGEPLPRLERLERAEEALYRVEIRRSNPSGSQCGWLRGRNLVVYRFAMERGRALYCGDPVLVLAHEIGHALGLDDVDPESCPRSIMATIHPGNRNSRLVRVEECAAVASAWTRTSGEPRLAEAPPPLVLSPAMPQQEAPSSVSADGHATPARN
jgi:hypothetical protein